VLDNGGFAVINKLQNNTGNESFNNLIADCPTVPSPSRSISRRMPPRWGRLPKRSPTRPNSAKPSSAPRRPKTHVIVMKVDAYEGWTTRAMPGGKSARRM
jgi:3D-(3,5/4)-trihydroxycyclohexane-1,2-dione acylhydrolase (decyclizing)